MGTDLFSMMASKGRIRVRLLDSKYPRLKRMAIPLMLALSGCGHTEILKMHDRGVLSPSLRITHDLSDSSQSGENTRKSRIAAELDIDHVSGTASDGIDASHSINFGGSQFNGPVELKGNYNLFVTSLAFRSRLNNNPADILGFAAMGGLSFQTLDLHLDAGNISAHDRTESVGPLLGFQLSLEPYSWLDLYIRDTEVIGFDFGGNTLILGLAELGLSVRPFSHVAFSGGFRRIHYNQSAVVSKGFGGSTDPRVRLSLTGPMLGIYLDF